MSLSQRTIAGRVSVSGVGLHSGSPVTLTLAPAPIDHGVVFVRTDLPKSVEIEARSQYVVDTSLATSLGKHGVRIGTVEHVLAALSGMGIDNARVEVNGGEIPIMDGSSAPFCYLIRTAGVVNQRKLKRFMVMQRTVEVREGDKVARLSPSPGFSISCTIDFQHPLIHDQTYRMDFSHRTFDREISKARTFGFLRDVEKLKQVGLARGGSLENAIVVDDFSILNPDGLRFPDEFVRHKILDAVGDLALMGMPMVGHLVAFKSGHALNQKLVRAVLADPSTFSVVVASKEFERTHSTSPGFEVAAEVA